MEWERRSRAGLASIPCWTKQHAIRLPACVAAHWQRRRHHVYPTLALRADRRRPADGWPAHGAIVPPGFCRARFRPAAAGAGHRLRERRQQPATHGLLPETCRRQDRGAPLLDGCTDRRGRRVCSPAAVGQPRHTAFCGQHHPSPGPALFRPGPETGLRLQPRRGRAGVPPGAKPGSGLRNVPLGRGAGAWAKHQCPDGCIGKCRRAGGDRSGAGAGTARPAARERELIAALASRYASDPKAERAASMRPMPRPWARWRRAIRAMRTSRCSMSKP
jgi:hypothetical protein